MQIRSLNWGTCIPRRVSFSLFVSADLQLIHCTRYKLSRGGGINEAIIR